MNIAKKKFKARINLVSNSLHGNHGFLILNHFSPSDVASPFPRCFCTWLSTSILGYAASGLINTSLISPGSVVTNRARVPCQ